MLKPIDGIRRAMGVVIGDAQVLEMLEHPAPKRKHDPLSRVGRQEPKGQSLQLCVQRDQHVARKIRTRRAVGVPVSASGASIWSQPGNGCEPMRLSTAIDRGRGERRCNGIESIANSQMPVNSQRKGRM